MVCPDCSSPHSTMPCKQYLLLVSLFTTYLSSTTLQSKRIGKEDTTYAIQQRIPQGASVCANVASCKYGGQFSQMCKRCGFISFKNKTKKLNQLHGEQQEQRDLNSHPCDLLTRTKGAAQHPTLLQGNHLWITIYHNKPGFQSIEKGRKLASNIKITLRDLLMLLILKTTERFQCLKNTVVVKRSESNREWMSLCVL